jgi:hypothetical protein
MFDRELFRKKNTAIACCRVRIKSLMNSCRKLNEGCIKKKSSTPILLINDQFSVLKPRFKP